jgi:hypothetical protein
VGLDDALSHFEISQPRMHVALGVDGIRRRLNTFLALWVR